MKFSKVLALFFTFLVFGFYVQAQNDNLDYLDIDGSMASDSVTVTISNVGPDAICITYFVLQGNIIIQDDVMYLNSRQLEIGPGEVRTEKYRVYPLITSQVTVKILEACNSTQKIVFID